MRRLIEVFSLLVIAISASAQTVTSWDGKRVGFLGDSMTDPSNKAASHKYCAVLERDLGIKAQVFARSGFMWDKMLDKAVELRDSLGDDVDAIFIFCGTNDFNHNRPIGEFYSEATVETNVNGQMTPRRHRVWSQDPATLAGSMNRALFFLKSNYPDIPIFIMTPIHRGYAKFGDKNVQPDEDFANGLGLYIEDYVAEIKRGAMYWSIPVIDLYGESGILPNLRSNDVFISNEETDRLHPSDAGHERIAKMLKLRLREWCEQTE